MYIDGLLIRLEETDVGCHMGIRFIGALAFADDLNLLTPTLSGLKILIDVCEKCAKEFNINYNGSKSRLLYLREGTVRFRQEVSLLFLNLIQCLVKVIITECC